MRVAGIGGGDQLEDVRVEVFPVGQLRLVERSDTPAAICRAMKGLADGTTTS